MTPEGKVKNHVKAILKVYRPQLYYHFPVQNGMGEPTLDCNGAVNGAAFAIECKAPGKALTLRQEQTATQMRAAGYRVFEIDGAAEQLSELRGWIECRYIRDAVALKEAADLDRAQALLR